MVVFLTRAVGRSSYVSYISLDKDTNADVFAHDQYFNNIRLQWKTYNLPVWKYKLNSWLNVCRWQGSLKSSANGHTPISSDLRPAVQNSSTTITPFFANTAHLQCQTNHKYT